MELAASGWLRGRGIEPHIPVIDKSKRNDDFVYDHKTDAYLCPAGKELRQNRRKCSATTIVSGAVSQVGRWVQSEGGRSPAGGWSQRHDRLSRDVMA